MQKTNILSGKWSQAGNFTGKNLSGERIFISKDLMASLGYSAGDVTTSFSCAYKTDLIGQLDEKGNPKVDANTGEPVQVARVNSLQQTKCIKHLLMMQVTMLLSKQRFKLQHNLQA